MSAGRKEDAENFLSSVDASPYFHVQGQEVVERKIKPNRETRSWKSSFLPWGCWAGAEPCPGAVGRAGRCCQRLGRAWARRSRGPIPARDGCATPALPWCLRGIPAKEFRKANAIGCCHRLTRLSPPRPLKQYCAVLLHCTQCTKPLNLDVPAVSGMQGI